MADDPKLACDKCGAIAAVRCTSVEFDGPVLRVKADIDCPNCGPREQVIESPIER